MSNLQSALNYASLGYHVFPLTRDTKMPLWGSRGFLDATTNENQIKYWWSGSEGKFCNIGIATGELSNLLVVDFDFYKEYDEDLSLEKVLEIAQERCGIDFVPTTTTHARGYQVWYRFPGHEIRSSNSARLGNNVDIRGNGGYVVAPPSVVKDVTYRFVTNHDMADAPEILVEKLVSKRTRMAERGDLVLLVIEQPVVEEGIGLTNARKYVQSRANGILRDIAKLQETGWDGPSWGQTCWQKSRDLVRIGRTEWTGISINKLKEAYDKATENLRDGDDKWDRRLVGFWETAMEHVDDYEPFPASVQAPSPVFDEHGDQLPGPPVAFEWNNFGNVERFLHYAPGRNLWVADQKMWCTFNPETRQWTRTEWEAAGGSAQEMWQSLGDLEGPLYSDEVNDGGDDSVRDKFMSYLSKGSTVGNMKNILEGAKMKDEVRVMDAELDTDPDLLGCKNGVLNMKTGELSPNAANMRVTRSVSCDYEPSATCPTWDQIMERQIPDPALRVWAETLLASSALQEGNTYKYFVVLWSEKDTGKSKVLQALKGMMGGYGGSFDMTMLKSKNESGPRPDLVWIHRRRLIVASETETNLELESGMIKRLTGSDDVSARANHSNTFIETPPSYTPILGLNNPPKINGADEALRRRIAVIPFGHSVPVHEQDTSIGEKLKAEYPGILARLVSRLANVDILKNIPDAFSHAADDIFAEINPVQQFLNEATEVDETAEVPNMDIMASYNYWREQTGQGTLLNDLQLGHALSDLGWKTAKGPKKFTGHETKQRYRTGRRLTMVRPARTYEVQTGRVVAGLQRVTPTYLKTEEETKMTFEEMMNLAGETP